MIGRTLNHYKVLERLGAGGMGEVFVAEDTRLHRKVALKVLPQQLAGDPSRWARFEREAQAVAALSHPNIVTVYSVEEAEGIRFITMELVPGRPLSDQIPRNGLALDRFFDLAVPLADAVGAAHRQGVIHRDLKPSNVVVGQDGRLRVLDFGLAKFREAGREGARGSELQTLNLTEEGKLLGTVAYMSPEQLEGKTVDHRADIFSLGVVLYEMATGQPPFKGDSGASVISSILRDTPASVTDLNPRLPRHLARILRQCLAKDPEQRTQTAQDVRNQLLELKREVETGEVRPAAPESRGARVARPLRLLGAGVAAVALLLIGWYASTRIRPGASGGGGAVEGTFLQLTDQSGEELFPSLSPDGKMVAYASRAAGSWDIYVQRVGGSNPVNLTADSPVSDVQPAFSPDGERIAFRSDRDGGGIFVMGATGESVLRVSDFGSRPAWSPDGTRVVFETQNFNFPQGRAASSELWQAHLGTGEKTKLSEGDAVQPSWSPGGGRIAFWGLGGEGGQRDLFTIPAEGGPPVAVTQDPPLDWNPVWSPDARFLYFSSDRGGSMNLWRVAIDPTTGRADGEPSAVTRGASAESHSASISRDGQRLVYVTSVSSMGLRRAALDPSSGRIAGEPAWVVRGSSTIVWVDLSPDGQWLAYRTEGTRDSTGSRHEEIVVSRPDGSARRRVVGGPERYRMPRWAPDGDEIAFFSDRGGKYEVWCVRPDGTGLRQVTAVANQTVYYPVWSPDGSRMVVSLSDGAILVIDPSRPWSEQIPERLPPVEGDLVLVPSSWSADGKRLAGRLDHKNGAPAGQAFYEFGTKRYEKVTDLEGIPSWLKDGRRWVFAAGDGSRVALLDTETRKITDLVTPTDGQVDAFGIALSHDNRTLLFTLSQRESDLWVLDLK